MKLKISTLFHWLYATLMFLPILMFIPSCLYYGFNEHATNETTTQINYKYQSNEVNTIDDLVIGNIYELNVNNDTADSFCDGNSVISFELLYFYSYDFSNYQIQLDETYLMSSVESSNINVLFKINNSWSGYLDLYFNDNDYIISNAFNNTLDSESFTINAIVRLLYKQGFNTTDYLTYTDYNVIESVETNVQDTISNKMYQAWEGVWNLPVFAWTKNSFVTAPFSYITGLFGLSSDNSINYVFTYFVSISICWLVFDLIMYVPNLAHRWLDRSAIE